MSLEDKSIGELEFRINACNFFLKWLRSSDPMLSDPNYSPYVPGAIARYEAQRNELLEVCRKKKVERDGDPNAEPVEIGLQSAKLTGGAGMR